MPLQSKKIILAVTGSIAAYKAPVLVRLLVKAGGEVRVITTAAAEDFVSPLTLATVSKNPVLGSVHDGASWNNHVELGLWADAMLIAPCSANTLAKLANGLCDTLVNAVYLSARCPVFVAPAMDEDMWLHPSTRANIEKLRGYGNHIVPVGHGELASGLVGEGRMAEPEALVVRLSEFLSSTPDAAIIQQRSVESSNSEASNDSPLSGLRALVTAGPTYERLDPVRFIGNFSTGKMGIALAESLARQGAEVTLVLGPTHLATSTPGIKTVHVESAEEMHAAATEAWPECSIAILAAAVADYRPAEKAEQKIKKADDAFTLHLTKTPDILATLGKAKRADQTLVGFALETENGLINAHEKRLRKGADLMVLNSLTDAGAGFGHDTNKVTLIARDGAVQSLPLLSKADVADAIVQKIVALHTHAAQPA